MPDEAAAGVDERLRFEDGGLACSLTLSDKFVTDALTYFPVHVNFVKCMEARLDVGRARIAAGQMVEAALFLAKAHPGSSIRIRAEVVVE